MQKPRKEEILEVATRLFAERGYEGVSIQDVADAVGLGKASLFHHFANKDALYEAVFDRVVTSLGEPLEAIYAQSGTFADRLDALTATLVGALGARPHLARLLLRETMDWGPLMRGKLAARILFVLEAGAAWIRAGQEEGSFVEGDPRHLVLTALGMHVLPFALGQLIERYTGARAFGPEFVDARTRELIRHARALHLQPGRDRARAPDRRRRRTR